MAYTPFSNDYSPDVAGQQRIQARQAARRQAVAQMMANGNQVIGALVTECCSDPAYDGQAYYDDSSASSLAASLVPGTPATAASPVVGIMQPSVPLTPVDILTNSLGFPVRPGGGRWPRPRIPASYMRRAAAAYPNYGATINGRSLVPNCPCNGRNQPNVVSVPQPPVTVGTPMPVPPAPVQNCPYPGCSTGNVCLDLITGCVSNSQVTQAQVEACTQAGYSTVGNSGSWLSAILLGCGNNLPYLGAPLPNPPQATGSMQFILAQANAAGVAASSKARGMGGFGQTDEGSNIGGFLAVMGMFGIVVWAMRK